MNISILTTRDAEAWTGYVARLPGADVYHTPAYHAAHEANGDGTALAFVAEDGDNLLLHPFLVRTIPGTDWRDGESVYGYSGPLAHAPDPLFLPWAWHLYADWCRENDLVAEFIRFNPLSDNQAVASCRCQIVADRETVVLDLSGDPLALWGRYTKTHRNMIRKAEKRGLRAERPSCRVHWSMRLLETLYRETMRRRGAESYYQFSPAYFAALEAALSSWAALFVLRDGAWFAAAALFLLHGDRMHYHLTGSDEGYRDSGGGNLLLHAAALWGQNHGYRYLHLGGGRTNRPDDSLLRFKASVSRERRAFHLGKTVHHRAAYDQLRGDWLRRHPGTSHAPYFLLWRKE